MTNFRDTDEAAAFIATAGSRETDPAIMEAITFFARDINEAVRLCGGTARTARSPARATFWERVTKNGLHDATEFCWGASGSQWWAQMIQEERLRHGPLRDYRSENDLRTALRRCSFRAALAMVGSVLPLAALLAVDERQVRRWASGDYAIPAPVAAWLIRLAPIPRGAAAAAATSSDRGSCPMTAMNNGASRPDHRGDSVANVLNDVSPASLFLISSRVEALQHRGLPGGAAAGKAVQNEYLPKVAMIRRTRPRIEIRPA